jgi:hypothetical protein
MFLTQPRATPNHEEPCSIASLEGASLRFAQAPRRALMRLPEPQDLFSPNTEGEKSDQEETKNKAPPLPAVDHQKELVKLLSHFSTRHSHWQVFSDFCELGALAISNAVDLTQRAQREERYMQIIKGYQREEIDRFPHALAQLTLALEAGFSDVLGRTYHDLELHNKWAGQFFTPYPVCQMMARMTIADCEDLKERIAERGFVTAQEPACGSGAMVIALAQEMLAAGVNYQEHLHVTAIDVDAKCVHMAYLQFSLLHIPAIIVHGNTLSLEEYGHWYTPAHIMGGWNWKLRRRAEAEETHEIHAPPPTEAAPVESPPEQKPDRPRGQMKLF